MSYKEALEDGIPARKDNRGFNWYFPPCRICSAPVSSWNYLHGAKYTCKDCREELVKLEIRNRCAETKDKKEKKLLRATKRIAKIADITLYDDAIAKVRNGFENPLSYQSTEEIMVALEFIRRGVVAYHQVPVCDYYVDFVIPQYRVALEIDGAPFHSKDKQSRELLRDEIIADKLGKDYEIIHITTDNINLNITKLIPAIKAVLAKRKSVQSSSLEDTGHI